MDVKLINEKKTKQTTIKVPSKELLIQMLLEEETIRFSSEYITECNKVASEPNGWLRISGEKQYEIAKKFGFTSEIEADIAVNHMRRAQYLYPEEPLFKTIPVYVRNNLAQQTKYKIQDKVPNLTIYQSNNDLSPIKLYETFNPKKINLLIASSHTWQPFRANVELIKFISSTFANKLNVIFVYISEAHAVDVWPIGLSAGTLNYKHKTLTDRLNCANKFMSEYNFNMLNQFDESDESDKSDKSNNKPIINTYLDSINDDLQNKLSAWPFRYYLIESDQEKLNENTESYKFKFIPDPSDSEFNLEELFKQIE